MAITQAVLTDFAPDPAFEPLLKRRSLGVLPAAGKPLVQFWCERLASAGFEAVHLVIGGFPEQVREVVEGGARWGLEVSMTTLREGASEADFLKAARAFSDQPCMLAPLHALPVSPLADVRLSLDDEPESRSESKSQVQDQGLCGLFTQERLVGISAWSDGLRFMRGPIDLWQVNRDLLDGKIDDPLPAGFGAGDGVRYGQHVQVRDYVSLEAPCFVGYQSQIGARCRVGPHVVIGSHCVIDQACRLSECLVLDHSFIGSHAELRDAIVDGQLIIKTDSGVATWIDDALIVHHMLDDRAKTGVLWRERFIALLLLVLFLPLMPLLALLSLVRGGVFDRESVCQPVGKDFHGDTDYRPLKLPSFKIAHGHWRRLPWLFSVVAGRLPLFGIRSWADLETQREQMRSSWARDTTDAQPGMISLAQLNGLSTARDEDSENILIANSYFLATRGFKQDLQLLGRWLLGLFKSVDAD